MVRAKVETMTDAMNRYLRTKTIRVEDLRAMELSERLGRQAYFAQAWRDRHRWTWGVGCAFAIAKNTRA